MPSMSHKRTFALALLPSEPTQHAQAEALHWWCYLFVLVATAGNCPAVGLAQGQPTSAQFTEARSRLVATSRASAFRGFIRPSVLNSLTLSFWVTRELIIRSCQGA